LSGADVAVGDGGVFEVLVEGFHSWVIVIIGRIGGGNTTTRNASPWLP
jgi:hypothetical protein